MKRYFSKRKWLFLLTLLLIVASDLMSIGQTVLEQRLIDAVLALEANQVKIYILLDIGFALVSGGVYVLSKVCQNLFSAKMIDDIRKTVFPGILQRSRTDFSEFNYSEYISVLTNDLSMIQRQYLGMLFLVVIFGGNMLLAAALMFYYQPLVALSALVGAAVMTVVPLAFGNCLRKWDKVYSEKLAAFTTCLTELFSGFYVISSFGIQKHAEKRFQACSSELKSAEYRANGLEAVSDGSAQLLSVTAQTLIFAFSCYMVFRSRMTMGALVAFVSLNQSFCGALTMVFRGIPMLRGVSPIIKRVNDFADYSAAKTGHFAVPTFHSQLEVKNLNFQYREGEKLLEDLSFSIHSGEKCALMGASGSGKTTLIRLLTGELDGYSGEILYDGMELGKLDGAALCKIASVIHQDVFLFDDTIRNNICLYEHFSEEDYDRAIRLSGVQKFMKQIPDGAEYRVGQRGEFLSGGQRQRIAIARALIRQTPFLILDEGTSALDAQTATEIEAELLSIQDLTLLTITHNLRNPQEYDQIMQLSWLEK